jgi:outer membrane protein
MRIVPFFASLALLFAGCIQPTHAQPASGWSARIGAGTLVSPAFQGARTYQLSALPAVRLAYGDRFFLSVEEGLGYAFLTGSFSAGPVVRAAFGRDEDGAGPFRIAGSRTNALGGLGDVPTTAEAGGFLRYRSGAWSAGLELRQGIGGHEALVANISAAYLWRFTSPFYQSGGPAFFSAGPRATFAGRNYAQTYFGVDAQQSARSGLTPYSPNGGLISFGVGGVAVMPVADRTAISLIAGYERLGSPAADSSLVRERGSKHQATVGLFATYEFTW